MEKIKTMNFKKNYNYINDNFMVYIKGYFNSNVQLLQILTPLLIFNFGKILEYYSLMINADIKTYQEQIANSLIKESEYKKEEEENKKMLNFLKIKNNNLENKLSQLNQKIEKLSQENQNKDVESTQMKKKIGELEKTIKYIEKKHNKETK